MIEMSEIAGVTDVEDNLIEDNQNRDLYKNREARSERIYPLSFVEFHHLHADLCLVTLEFFLNSFYFWLYDLHATLRDEHALLWDEEGEPDN